jgi:membrane protease YdiL (CAAX protease family)
MPSIPGIRTWLRPALWLNAPSLPSGRRGGRLWWWAVAATVTVGVIEFAGIDPAPPVSRNMGKFLASPDGHATLHGNWGFFAIVVAMAVFNTVLGEELLFRGVLLPRMSGAFGRADWAVNGVIFGLYHLHQPWSMPTAILGGLVQAYGTRRLRSAWIGIIAHSAQSVLIISLTLAVVPS